MDTEPKLELKAVLLSERELKAFQLSEREWKFPEALSEDELCEKIADAVTHFKRFPWGQECDSSLVDHVQIKLAELSCRTVSASHGRKSKRLMGLAVEIAEIKYEVEFTNSRSLERRLEQASTRESVGKTIEG